MRPPNDVIARLRRLGQEDWDRITVQLLKHATHCFLRAGIPVLAGAVRGMSIGDIVQDAIEGVWSGRRTWPENVPLLTLLRNAVRSELSNLLTSAEASVVDEWAFNEGHDQEVLAEDELQARQADSAHDHARHLPRKPQTPEEIAAQTEEIEKYHDLLLEAAGDDGELIRYLDALDRGLETPALIAMEWGVDRKTIYRLENRLRKRVRSLIRAWRESTAAKRGEP